MQLGIMQPTNPQTLALQPRSPIRRAVYIHVSDLTSAYNIDHKKLQTELDRVIQEGQKNNSDRQLLLASSLIEPVDDSRCSAPQKRLLPPRGGYNLCLLVGDVHVVVDKLRVDRSRVRLAEVNLGDETGVVSLRARDEQIDLLQKVSHSKGAVVLRNCTLELFQGKHIRLAITKWGKINTYPDELPSTPPPPTKINLDRNYSMIDLSMVASEMVENTPPDISHHGSNREMNERSRVMVNQTQHFQPPRQVPYMLRPGQVTQKRRQTPRSVGIGSPPTSFTEGSTMGYPLNPTRYPGIQHGFSYVFSHGPQQGQPIIQQRQQQSQHSHLLQHQYEMQQRQLHHLHAQAYHEQQGRQQALIQRIHHMQPPPSPLSPTMRAASSFESQGQISTRDPQMTSPLPELSISGVPGQSVQQMSSAGPTFPYLGKSTVGSAHIPPHFSGQSNVGSEGLGTDHGSWGYRVGPASDDPTIPPGRMNPQAATFAPTFDEPQQQGRLRQHQQGALTYGYTYMTGQQPGQPYRTHQHPDFGMIYVPIHHEQPVLASSTVGSTHPDTGNTEEQQDSVLELS